MSNRTIIKRALRMLGVLASGRDPSANQATDALEALQSWVLTLPAFGIGARWVEQEVTSDATAEEDDRIRITTTDPITIYIPVSTQGVEREVDSCGSVTVISRCTDGRAPKDGAKVWIADAYGTLSPRLYLYRADRAEWILANALTLDGESALNAAMDQAVAAILTVLLAPEFGAQVTAEVALLAQRGETQIGALYGPDMATRPDPALAAGRRFNIVTG